MELERMYEHKEKYLNDRDRCIEELRMAEARVAVIDSLIQDELYSKHEAQSEEITEETDGGI